MRELERACCSTAEEDELEGGDSWAELRGRGVSECAFGRRKEVDNIDVERKSAREPTR